jgi:hypothetical protein
LGWRIQHLLQVDMLKSITPLQVPVENLPPIDGFQNLATQAGFPIWVLRVDLSLGRSLPVYPDDRTSADRAGRSVSCHERTHASQQIRGNSLAQI